MIHPPDGLARAIVCREGDLGRQWLASLPALTAQMCERWDLEICGQMRHGETALVVPVQPASGLPAVLRLSFPHPEDRSQTAALRSFNGHGAVRLLCADDTTSAQLLERAGPRTLADVEASDSVEIAGELARRLAIPADAGTPALADATAAWEDQLDRQLAAEPNDLPAGAIERARHTIRLLANDRTSTMIHGDLHPKNILEASREHWLAIDPKGWRGTAAFDAFTVVASDHEPINNRDRTATMLQERIDRFAVAAHVDRGLASACCQARAVSSYLYQLVTEGDWFDLDVLRSLATDIL